MLNPRPMSVPQPFQRAGPEGRFRNESRKTFGVGLGIGIGVGI
jgi:hypothetical protein